MELLNTGFEIVLRWIHYVAGVLWIGLLYFFNFINAHFEKTLSPDAAKTVVPALRSRVLFWFRWGAMFTFISGILLILWLMHGGAYTSFGEDRVRWILFGAGFGTIMWFNVWFIIWPAQKKIIAFIKAGENPPEKAKLATRALHASRTNVFLSVPLLFFMGAAAHPHLAFGGFGWVKLLAVIAIGFFVAWLLVFKFSSKVASNA